MRYPSALKMKRAEAERLHADAVSRLVSTASGVPESRWRAPRSEGKWSPAETVEHLTIAYDVLLRELAGGGGMAIRTKLWQRILLRFTLVPKILRGGAFPKSARAPRETRPQMPEHGQAEAIARFQERAARFNDAASDPRHTRARLTHAYFGRSSVTESMVLCARHIEHHRAQLEG